MSQDTGLRPPETSAQDELLLRLCRLPASGLQSWLTRVAVALRLDVIEVWSLPPAGGRRPSRLARHVARVRNGVSAAAPATDVSALKRQRVVAYPRGRGGGLAAGIWRGETLAGVLRCERDVHPAWTAEEHVAVATVADRVGLMLEHAEQQERAQRELRERETQRQEAEAALSASEEAYRTIFQYSAEAIWVHDTQTGAMLDVNQAGCDLYGYTREEMLTLGHDALLYPGSEYTAERVAEYMGRTLAGEIPRFEWMGRHKDGSPTWGEVTLRRVTVSGQDRILAMVRDIRERKAAEQELRRANEELEQRVAERTAELAASNLALAEEVAEHQAAREQLRASEEHFRRLIENSSDQLMIADATGAITYVGPSVLHLLGYTPEEMLGARPADLVHPDDVERVMGVLGELFAHPGEMRVAEYRIRHRDGSWRVFETVGRTLSPDSSAEGVVANGRDVTERRRTEEALREATAAAEQANRAKSEFLSRMSHELRTPMNSILGFAQVLEGQALSQRHERCVQHILRAGHHLLKLINEVLEISRIEAGRQNLSLEPVRAGAVLQEALGLARPLATQAGVELVYDALGDEADYVHADRQRLSQVLLNLLSNAIKYNRAGGSVRVSCERIAAGANEAARLRVRVEDAGRGIAPERQAELFTPFARLGAENSDIEGTGLGLALSHRLMEAMGGRLVLERTGAEGSVFAIELPLTQIPLQRVEEGAGPPRARTGVPHDPATLLYIEDNLANP